MEEEVEFNYFYQMFVQGYQRALREKLKNKISQEDDEDDLELYLMFPVLNSTKEEILKAYDTSLFHVCETYISLSDSKMEKPNNSFEFVTMILDEIEENPYKESILKSLQFIYQDYLNCLEIGYPSLWNSDDDQQDSYMEVTFDSQNKILDFETVNMELLEQTKTMTKFFIMQKDHQEGPLQKVKYHYRKDI